MEGHSHISHEYFKEETRALKGPITRKSFKESREWKLHSNKERWNRDLKIMMEYRSRNKESLKSLNLETS
ncbi:hypothetical protein CR513_01282, partial [Mucuna pruriens]